VESMARQSGANDNGDISKPRSEAWKQGYADGLREVWSKHLADENGPVGDDYLEGWIAGNESRPG
jgi:hypothetical protein